MHFEQKQAVDVCLEMFGCLQAERTIAIRKRKFFKKNNEYTARIVQCIRCYC